jgi:hypothetical protein
MERLRAEALGDEDDRTVSERVAESEQRELPFAGRYAAEANQSLFLAAALSAGSGQAVAEGTTVQRKIAHQPERAEAASRVATEVDDQPVAVLEGCDRTVDVAGDVDSDETRENVDLEVADVPNRSVNDGPWQSEQLARFRVGYVEPNFGVVAVTLGHTQTDAAADAELRRLRGVNRFSVDREEKIAGLYPGTLSRSLFLNVGKHEARAAGRVAGVERRADRLARRDRSEVRWKNAVWLLPRVWSRSWIPCSKPRESATSRMPSRRAAMLARHFAESKLGSKNFVSTR